MERLIHAVAVIALAVCVTIGVAYSTSTCSRLQEELTQLRKQVNDNNLRFKKIEDNAEMLNIRSEHHDHLFDFVCRELWTINGKLKDKQ